MFKLFKTRPVLDSFYQQHKVAADKEHLLNIGAMLLEYNQYRDSLTLTSRLKSGQIIPLLNSAWEIDDQDTTLSLLNELLTLPSLDSQVDYVNGILLHRQNIHQLAYEVLVEPANLYKSLEVNCQSLFEKNGAAFDRISFDATHDVAAWDIERAGLVVRYAYNAAWMSEQQTWGFLEKLYALAKAHYKTWADYYVAYMKARTLFYEQRETEYIDYVLSLKEMYKSPDFFCLRYPLWPKNSRTA